MSNNKVLSVSFLSLFILVLFTSIIASCSFIKTPSVATQDKMITHLQKIASEYQDNVQNGFVIIKRGNRCFILFRIADDHLESVADYHLNYFSHEYSAEQHDESLNWVSDSLVNSLLLDLKKQNLSFISKEKDITHLRRDLWDRSIELFCCNNGYSLKAIRDSIQAVRSGSIIRSGQTDRSYWAICSYDPDDRFE